MGVFLYEYDTVDVLDSVVEDAWFEEGTEAREQRINYQDFFECCGWADPFDSRASGYNTPCTRSNPDSCRDATLDWLAQFYTPIAIFAIVFAMFQLMAVGATLAMLFRAKADEDDILDWLW
mmetsp:Transcript_26419/g.46837  ORF Transcript_26419/g.46837 Transcript_26419/m.46837 type:complete len:121 (+) Transcript_26419:355-717(+)